MFDGNMVIVSLGAVSVVAAFAICVAVKKSWDADFYKIMCNDLKRQNDSLFDSVKEL